MKIGLLSLVLILPLFGCTSKPVTVSDSNQRVAFSRYPSAAASETVVLKYCDQNPFSARDGQKWNDPKTVYNCVLALENETNPDKGFTGVARFPDLEALVKAGQYKMVDGQQLGSQVPRIQFTPAIKITGNAQMSGEDYVNLASVQALHNGHYVTPSSDDFIAEAARDLSSGRCPQFEGWLKKDVYHMAADLFEQSPNTISKIENQSGHVKLAEFDPGEAWVRGPANYFKVSGSGKIKQLMFGPYSSPFQCK